AWARAYAAFAAAHRERWRALFEFRMAKPRDFPDWFAADQLRVFERLETRLAPFLPRADAGRVRARARALFAAVHGIVALGLDEKLVGLDPAALDAELEAFVTIYVDGLARGAQGLSGSHTSVSSL
ncbi:MAG: WHG domain-containing protein, partial [Caulobacteraceae bacterium]|nr:WHG domain-containing protein [Caulobacter sp.]